MKAESKGKSVIYQGREISLGYGQINHLIPHDLWQCGLSLPALGLASYLYTLPKQWKLSVTHLSKQLVMSKNTCRKYLKEIFTNPKACEVFKVKEVEINTYDFEEGFTAYDYAIDTQELENFTSSVAKDVSEPNRKRVLLIQTQRQRYLLNLCFKGMEKADSNPNTTAKDSKICDEKTSEAVQGAAAAGFFSKSLLCEQAQGSYLSGDLRACEAIKDLSRKAESTSVKISPKQTAQILSTIKRDSKESLKDSSLKHARKNFSEYLDLKRFSKDEQEAIKLWITYKQESSKTTLKPAQVDFQLRKITRFKEQGQDICAVIEKSLDMGWQGLFANKDSALRDKAGSLPFVCAIDTQVLSPHKSRRNPAFSSQNQRSGASAAQQVSLEILESQAVTGVKPKMPKNIGGKAALKVLENA